MINNLININDPRLTSNERHLLRQIALRIGNGGHIEDAEAIFIPKATRAALSAPTEPVREESAS